MFSGGAHNFEVFAGAVIEVAEDHEDFDAGVAVGGEGFEFFSRFLTRVEDDRVEDVVDDGLGAAGGAGRLLQQTG